MKLALVTDTHWGARNDSRAFMNYFMKFYDDVFFPYLEENKIDTLIHLGDIVDRRKFINFRTLQDFRQDFIYRLGKMGIDTHILVGNHDTYLKSSNKINAMTELFSTFKGDYEPWVYPEAQEVMFDELKILFVPWINEENYESTQKLINDTDAEIVMGHLEVSGFEMYKGLPNAGGISASVFNKFDRVMSGHFHHKSDNGTIYYLGAPYEMTWSDYQDPRGFHVFDTDTRELTYIKNPHRMFHKVFYDDTGKTFEEVTQRDFSQYEGACVKVVVQSKTNPYWFDIVIDGIDKVNPAALTVVEDHGNITDALEGDLVDQAEDTMTILNKYVDGLSVSGKKGDLKELLQNLHKEAVTMDLE